MKTIRHTNTLFSYDGPQVFEARDATGGRCISNDHAAWLAESNFSNTCWRNRTFGAMGIEK